LEIAKKTSALSKYPVEEKEMNRLLTQPKEDGLILFDFQENIKENIQW
jgi:hypothetical protein